uniref:Prospero homeobox 1 n=1 Tax=Equus asinus asinus TaxID=83772 RepID=A0A8C4L3L8_EQUAS
MPDHDSTALLSRQTREREIDIGVKRTVGTASAERERERATFFSAMNPQGSEQDVEYSVVQHADGEKSNVLRKLLKRANSYEDAMMPFPGATIISQLLKNNMNKNGGTEPSFQASGLSSTGSEVQRERESSNSSRDSPPECLSERERDTMSQFDMDRLCDERERERRARVENIIRGMSHSPSVALRGNENEREMAPQSVSPRESYRENKRKQKLPQQQQQSFQQLVSARKEQKREERRQLKQQLEDMQKQLRQERERDYQIYDSTDSENDEGEREREDSMRSEILEARAQRERERSDNEMCELDPGQFEREREALIREQEMAENKPRERERNKERDHGPNSLQPERERETETLKQELNTAMSQEREREVKVFSAKPSRQVPRERERLQIPQARFAVNGEKRERETANQRLQCFGDVIIERERDTFGNVQMPTSTDQRERERLVVRKNSADQSASGRERESHHQPLHQSPLSATERERESTFRHPFPLPLMAYPFQSPLGAPSGSFSGKDRASPESLDLTRETTSLRTKMSSHHLSHHPCSPAHPPSTAEGLSLSLIKSECGDLQDMSEISPYSGSEGLSPNHLKKAKLMFFYTRYPREREMKTYFSDVKRDNRCITSQLIKWFSRERERYYIQMEKYARQAIKRERESTEELSITRDCELYEREREHYNKANDFEVPERFLEVAQITLREFFNAIIAGKDVDPSWKKAIYKVICKLDSEVPEIFKSPNCLQELLHE